MIEMVYGGRWKGIVMSLVRCSSVVVFKLDREMQMDGLLTR